MATDKVIYEYATYFPNAMAKFIDAENDDYQAKSITFKETEKRADIFLDESHYHAAEKNFKRQFEKSSLLRFTPRVFIFSRIQVEELGAM
ncbi:MAG: hypothetical protein ACE5I1_25360, partial [bacterium]